MTTTMDCVICSDEISATTGRTIMGCGHEFHTKCLVQWLQKPDGTGSCPCCRREPGEMEKLVAPPEDEDEDQDEDDDMSLSNFPSATPLMSAARDRKHDEIRRLLAEGAEVDAKDSDNDTALKWAEDDESRKILVEAGADITLLRTSWQPVDIPRTKHSALLAACEDDSPFCVEALLNAGADPNYADPKTGISPLMESIRSESSISIIELLIKKGANVFQTDAMDWNAFLWFADVAGETAVMHYLLRGAGIEFDPQMARPARTIQAVWRGFSTRRQHHAVRSLLSLSA